MPRPGGKHSDRCRKMIMEVVRDHSLRGSERVEQHEARVERATVEYIEGKHSAADTTRRGAEGPQVEPGGSRVESGTPIAKLESAAPARHNDSGPHQEFEELRPKGEPRADHEQRAQQRAHSGGD